MNNYALYQRQDHEKTTYITYSEFYASREFDRHQITQSKLESVSRIEMIPPKVVTVVGDIKVHAYHLSVWKELLAHPEDYC